MTNAADLDGAEIDGQNVKGGFGGALECGHQVTGIAVRANGGILDDRGQYPIGPGTAERPQQRHWKRVRRKPDKAGDGAERLDQHFHGAR